MGCSNLDIVKFLVELGASSNVAYSAGVTLIEYAAETGYQDESMKRVCET